MNKYKQLDQDELEEHLSNFLVNSWSYSAVTTFSRNEKEFEKRYIYRESGRVGASSVAGNAYHAALDFYFKSLKEQGCTPDLIELQQIAYEYIDDLPSYTWKLQKTTPTVYECRIKANKLATSALENFCTEISEYCIDDISEVVCTEGYYDEWITVNGVDIPLPVHAQIDLVVKMNDGRTVLIDHKSKSAYTGDDEAAFVIAKQAMTYTLAYEEATGTKIDDVWFIENKTSKNKDKSKQLKKIAVTMDDNTRKLYGALLYEPIKRMIEAVSNPDYVYTINDSDTMCDRAELYAFWARTLISEVEDYINIPDEKRDMIQKRLRKVRDSSLANISPKVITKFKENASAFIQYDFINSNMDNKQKIEHILRTFGMHVQVAHEIVGFSCNTYLLEVGAGVKVSNISKYALDIANALNVASVRMGKNLVVYEEKSYVSIEVAIKRTRTLTFDSSKLVGNRIPIGVDNYGEMVVWDMDNHSTPHMLICGATGSGKSVSIRSTIKYAMQSGVNDVYIFDPKFEFSEFRRNGAHVLNDIDDIELQMQILVDEMQKRAKSGTNKRTLIVFDEFADAVASARSGRELAGDKSLEQNLKMLLQKGRSLGFRIIAATQRASVQVITGDAKVNFPVQICFRVPKAIDSKVVIDEEGAESLSGQGDGLIKSPEYFDVKRFQGFY